MLILLQKYTFLFTGEIFFDMKRHETIYSDKKYS